MKKELSFVTLLLEEIEMQCIDEIFSLNINQNYLIIVAPEFLIVN